MEKTSAISIGIPMVNQSMEGARVGGYDIDRLLLKSGISPEQLEQPETRVPLEKFVILCRYTAGAMDDELAGLLSKPFRLGFFRAMALSAVHAETIDRAFQRAIEFSNLFENSLQLQLVNHGKQAEFIVTRRLNQLVLNSLAIERTLIVHHRLFGWLANECILLNQVKLDFPKPAHSNEYRHMFYGAPVIFGQNHNSLLFESAYLERKIVQNETSMEGYIRRAPMDLFLPLDAGGKITTGVRNRVNSTFITTETVPELDKLAKEMQLHPQTLRRQLKREGSSFHSITAQVRRDIAIHYLGTGKLSIESIAYKTGYSESRAFIRAFKAWTGFTPLQFRKGLDI